MIQWCRISMIPMRKLFFGLGGVAAFLLIGVAAFLKLNTATITVKTDPTADIYVRQGGTADYKKIGTGTAGFKTRSEDLTFVESRYKDQVSQTAVTPRRRQNIQIEVKLQPLVKAQRISEGPLAYLHVQGNLVFGLNPQVNNLSVKPLVKTSTNLPRLPALPFLRQLIWTNNDSYIYVSLGQGAGMVRAGVVKLDGLPYISAAISRNRTLALLASDGVYLAESSNIGRARKIGSTVQNSTPSIFADNEGIYFSSLVYEEPTDESDEPVGKETQLGVFNTKGKKVENFTLAIKNPLYTITPVNKTMLALLSQSELTLLDRANGSTETKSFSFGKVRDMLMYKDKLLLLGDAGLWEYSLAQNTYHKVATYPEGEEYVANSLTVSGSKLYLSTSVSDEQLLSSQSSSAQSSVYQLSLE